MNKLRNSALTFAVSLALILSFSSLGADEKPVTNTLPKIDESLLREATASIQRAVNYLTDHQMEDGSWLHHPAITGLITMSLLNSHSKLNPQIRQDSVEKGRQFMLKFVQRDGSIWMADVEKEYPNYTTAICLATLAVINRPEDEHILRNARKFLIDSQLDEDNKDNPTKKDNPSYGGIGYGKAGAGTPDLSNTQWALEALYLTEYLDKEPKAKSPEDAKKADLAWGNAVMFLNRLQHVPESNDQVWVVKDKNDPNYGGFVYKPDESKADEKFEQKGLRSYGSMTYAGLKSMIYAKLKKDDPRVKAAVEWAGKNYTLDQNPGMGAEGHYYYLITFAKAHAVLGDEIIVTPDGKKYQWRADMIKKLLELQKGKGEWYNDKHGRWMESIPELVTAYSLMAMEAALGPYLAD
ncbi:MAG: prenyltransferase/squalene oxidase repeat-containing protein [Victivallales bacterium]